MFLVAMYPVPKNEEKKYMQWFQNKILKMEFSFLSFINIEENNT